MEFTSVEVCQQPCYRHCLKKWTRTRCRARLPPYSNEEEEANQEIMERVKEVRTVLEYQCWIMQLFIFSFLCFLP